MLLIACLALLVAQAPAPSDGGVPRSDECAGEALQTGRCRCAHHQCNDLCCRQDEVCAHGGSGPGKCIRPPSTTDKPRKK